MGPVFESTGAALRVVGAAVGLLATHGGMLLLGVGGLLGAGFCTIRLQRSPLHRQRLGELTVACTALWVVLACVPMPRWLRGAEGAPAGSTRPGMDGASGAAPPIHRRALPARRVPAPATEPVDPVWVARGPSVRIDVDAAGSSSRREGEEDAKPRAAVRAEFSDSYATDPVTGPVPRPVSAPVPAPVDVRRVVAWVYLGGASGCFAWLVLGRVLLWRLVARGAPAPPWLLELLTSLADARRRPPRLLVSARCSRPISCGLWRPTVLLPAGVVGAGHRNLLRQVLLHELAHVRQRDAWGNALLNLALPLLYAHPLYWLVRRDVELARELVADDWAAARSGKACYVAELVAMARSAMGPRGAAGAPGPVALFGSPTHFYRRMHMLIRRRENLPTSCSRGWRLVVTMAFTVVLGVATGLGGLEPARAQDRPETAAADLAREGVDAGREARQRAEEVAVLRAQLQSAHQALQEATLRLDELKAQSQSAQDQLARQLEETKIVKERQLVAEQRAREVAVRDAREAQAHDAQMRELVAAQRHPESASAAVPDTRRVDGAVARNLQDDLRTGGNAGLTAAPAAAGLDLVTLAVAYVDAAGDVRTARARLERTAKLAGSNDVSPLQLDLDKATLDTAQRKAELLRMLVDIARAAASAEHEQVRKLVDERLLPQSRLAETEARLKILELIAKSGQ